MPRGRRKSSIPKKEDKPMEEQPLGWKDRSGGGEDSPPLLPEAPPEAPRVEEVFSTTDMRVTDLLNRRGISPSSASGSPMVYAYSREDSAQIPAILKEAGL